MFSALKAYSALIIAVLWAVSLAWMHFYSVGVGEDKAEAAKAREERLVREAVDAVSKTTAEAIAGIEVKNVTIRQEVQREIVKEPVYRDCVHSPSVMRNINATLSGATQPAGDSKLPATD